MPRCPKLQITMLAGLRLGQSALTFSSSSCTPKLCPKYVRALACELEVSAAAAWHLLAACSMPCDQKAGETQTCPLRQRLC